MIYPRHRAGYTDLPKEVVIRAIRNWVAEGKTSSPWGENTVSRVTRNSARPAVFYDAKLTAESGGRRPKARSALNGSLHVPVELITR